MSEIKKSLESIAQKSYEYGFVTDIESESIPPGLSEDIVRLISQKKNEPQWLLDFRLKAYAHFCKLLANQSEPTWAKVSYPAIDFNKIVYYSAPKPKTSD